ncbi:MAG TPA: CDP-alcohol phosphatidyltransferase family protein [Candidatus Binatia bacterium]
MREPERGTLLIFLAPEVDPAATFVGRDLLDRARALAEVTGLAPALVSDGRPIGQAHGLSRLEPGAALPTDGPVVLLRADVACVAGAVRDLLAADGAPRAARDDRGRIALVRTTATALGGRVPSDLESAAVEAEVDPRQGWLGERRVLALSYAKLGTDPDIAAVERTRVERELLESLDNPRDGFLDRVLNRHLSRPLSLELMRRPVTPNQITVAGVLLAFLGAALIALPGIFWPVLGALLLQATAVLDCVDGEIARAKVQETEWGEWLDITSDTLIHIATFLGIAVHAWPELGTGSAWALGALFAFGGLASFAVVTYAEKTEERWKPLDIWQSRLLATMLATLTTRDTSILVLLAAVTGLLTELLIGAALGAQVFWFTALMLLADLLHRAEQAASAR